MYVDPSGHAWWHWILGGLIVVALGIALVASAGSFFAAGVAIYSALNGIAFAGATTTVLSFAFVGAAMVYTGSLLYNAVNIATSELRGSTYSYSINRMEEMGGYVLGTTVMMGASFGYAGYIAYLDQLWMPDMSYDTYRKKKLKELANIEGKPFGDNDRLLKGLTPEGYVMHHPYGRFGSDLYRIELIKITEHKAIHHVLGYGRGQGGFSQPREIIDVLGWLMKLFFFK